jgi:opacity protein-like surface antigen
MKRILGLPALAALLMAPCMAQAEVGIYVAPKLGYGKLKGSVGDDSVFGGGIAVGYDFHKRFNLSLRAELEYAGFNNAKDKNKYSYPYGSGNLSGTDTISIGANTLFANAYYDFRNNSKFTPYVGLGLGSSFLDTRYKSTVTAEYPWGTVDITAKAKKSNTDFAWNVGGGVAYALTSNVSLDLAYRYANLGKIKSSVKPFDLDMHQAMLGLRVAF